MSGAEVFDLFSKSGARDYVLKHFESLHTTGNQYILNDIDEFLMNHRKTKEKLKRKNLKRKSAQLVWQPV